MPIGSTRERAREGWPALHSTSDEEVNMNTYQLNDFQYSGNRLEVRDVECDPAQRSSARLSRLGWCIIPAWIDCDYCFCHHILLRHVNFTTPQHSKQKLPSLSLWLLFKDSNCIIFCGAKRLFLSLSADLSTLTRQKTMCNLRGKMRRKSGKTENGKYFFLSFGNECKHDDGTRTRTHTATETLRMVYEN